MTAHDFSYPTHSQTIERRLTMKKILIQFLLGIVAIVLMGTTSFAQLISVRALYENAAAHLLAQEEAKRLLAEEVAARLPEQEDSARSIEGAIGVEMRTFSLFNSERAKRNLPSLQWSNSLYQTARSSAQMQNSQQRVGHPLGGTEISASGNDPAQVVQMWLNSPGHRAILLSPQYTHAAVGNSGRYWSGRFSGGGASDWTGTSNRSSTSGQSGRLTMDQIRERW
jgi:hypothetical protein